MRANLNAKVKDLFVFLPFLVTPPPYIFAPFSVTLPPLHFRTCFGDTPLHFRLISPLPRFYCLPYLFSDPPTFSPHYQPPHPRFFFLPTLFDDNPPPPPTFSHLFRWPPPPTFSHPIRWPPPPTFCIYFGDPPPYIFASQSSWKLSDL